MVRRSLRAVALFCTLAVILAQPITASAAGYSCYEGTVSSTFLTIFQGVVSKISPMSDYVFFRSDQYEYMLVVGDITLESGTFETGSCTVYRILTNSSYNSSYSYSIREEADFSLTVQDALVYSNLGHYPDLRDQSAIYSFSVLLLLLIVLFMNLARSIFGFTMRRR